MKTADKFIKQCQAWVGLNEKDGSHMEIINIYNSQKPLPRSYKLKSTSAWCAAFVSAVSVKLGYTDIVPTECSCGKMIEKHQASGTWVETDSYIPKTGDLIFYDWDDSSKKSENKGWPDHVGVVESVSGKQVTVIEGNMSNKVGRRVIAVDSRYIRGYAAPKYEKGLYFPKFTSKSIVDGLKSIKVDSSFGNRKLIWKANFTGVYLGLSSQNIKLLNLASQGKLKKPV